MNQMVLFVRSSGDMIVPFIAIRSVILGAAAPASYTNGIICLHPASANVCFGSASSGNDDLLGSLHEKSKALLGKVSDMLSCFPSFKIA